jgi:D-serine dehydratase
MSGVEEIRRLTIDDRFKGMPLSVRPFELREIGKHGWNVLAEDLPLPLAVLKKDALDHNRAWMRRFLRATGAQLYPHGKTTMSPQLFALQQEDGARGISVATVHQLAIARRYGVKRILLANQLIAPTAIQSVIEQLQRDEDFELLCLVDSIETVQRLSGVAQRLGARRPIDVLLEVGSVGGRCGARDLTSAMQVARAASKIGSGLRLCGVEGFEGTIAGSTLEETEAAISRYLVFLCEVATKCCDEGWLNKDTMIFSAGGSAFFDLVVQAGKNQFGTSTPQVILRSGCYLTHDSQFYRNLHTRLLNRFRPVATLGEGLRASLEIWSYVQSRPEPTRAVLNMGKRDCSYDIHLPVITHWYRPKNQGGPISIPPDHRIVSLNDQHAIVDIPADSPLGVGDLVAAGISHPCTTFDKWQLIPMVDETYQVIDAIRTFF